MIKKIYNFFGGPKIRFQINEYLKSNVIMYQNYILKKNEFYKLFNDFRKSNEGYDKIDIKLNHNQYSKEINPKEHFKIVEKLDIKLNPLYFKNLHTYGIRGIIFDKLYGKKIKEKYFLLPPNIVFLELISRINTKFLKNQKIVDIPSGLGNFLGYLSVFLPKECIVGIDNFSQISRKKVMLYQNETFGYNVFSNSYLKERTNYFIWIIGGLPISFLENEIRKFKPKYLFIETTYIPEFHLISNDYQIDFFNEIVIILKLKNINSIKKYFIDN
tara:strand:+ start:170 stop:985 length:816 start_codon:yes stop_codon:yes gene_type:complete